MRQERAGAFEHKAVELGVAGAALTSRKNWRSSRHKNWTLCVNSWLTPQAGPAKRFAYRADQAPGGDLRDELDRAQADAHRLHEEASQACEQATAETEVAYAPVR